MRIPLVTLPLLMLPTLADAGEETPMSQAVEAGFTTVVEVEALETRCETFSIDEDANRSSTFSTLVSLEEVYLGSNDIDAPTEELVVGESVELRWYGWEAGPFFDPGDMGCMTPEFSIRDGARRPLALTWYEARWSIDPWYYDDFDSSAAGTGALPPCGEDEQAALVASLQADDASEELGTDDPQTEGEKDETAGCSSVQGASLHPLLALLGLLGLARRRR